MRYPDNRYEEKLEGRKTVAALRRLRKKMLQAAPIVIVEFSIGNYGRNFSRVAVYDGISHAYFSTFEEAEQWVDQYVKEKGGRHD